MHLVYDIIKLRLLQGCVDYNVKNNLDSASGHHFLPIYTYRSSNIIIDHFIATKNRLRQRLCAFSEDIIKLRLLQGCVDYNVKNNLDSASGHHFLPIYPSDHQIKLLIISLHLKIDCVNVYGHLVYDITKLRLLQVCVDYTVKNDLDSAAGHHFLPYTPSDNQIYLLIISLQLKIDCVNVYGHLVHDITKLRLLQGCVDYNVKNNLDSASGHHFLPIYPSDHQI